MRIFLCSLLFGMYLPMFGQVFISEYIEGSGNNKCVEIYNGSGATIDLVAGGYGIAIYANGSPTPTASIAFSGPPIPGLAPGDVYVLCNPGANAGLLALSDQTTGSLNFNGNDAVALFNSGGTLDVIGQIGFDPGTEWNAACCPDGTNDGTMTRKPYLTSPAFNGASAFDPDSEWDCDPIDTFSDLGTHSTVSCAIDKLIVTQSSCNNGIASVSLDFTPVNLSANFDLTVTPDPGGLSGTYAVSSLPLTLAGFTGDNTTQYDFLVEDNLSPGLCLSQQVLDLTFDCPVADALSFSIEPQGCVETSEVFQIEVCAIETSSGSTQPDYSQTITLSLNGSPTGTLTGSTSQVAVNGCASFSFTYDAVETISFTASDGTLPNASSSSYSLAVDCPHLTIYTGFINPCGNDGPNELIAMSSGDAPVDVQDLVFASIDQSAAVQPDVRHTWSQSGSDIAGSTTRVCGLTSADIKCHRIMDISNPTDNATITTLLGALNTQAGCAGNLFVSPTGGGMGTIPANAPVIMFLGAGGNPGTIAAGFHNLGTNLDFSSFCGYAPIYAIFGEHINTIATFGFFSNTSARTYQVSIDGDITSQLAYTTPSSATEPERVTLAGAYSAGGDCTPLDLFGDFVLEDPVFELSLHEKEEGQVSVEWVNFTEEQEGTLIVERSEDGEVFEAIMETTNSPIGSFVDQPLKQGHLYYRMRMSTSEGPELHSEIESIFLKKDREIFAFRLFPNPAEEELLLQFHAQNRQRLLVDILSVDGRKILGKRLLSEEGLNSISLNINTLASGVYLLRFRSGTSFFTRSFFKR